MDMEDQLEREMAAEEEEQLVQMALDHEYSIQNPLCKEFSLPADFTFKSLPPSPLYQSKSKIYSNVMSQCIKNALEIYPLRITAICFNRFCYFYLQSILYTLIAPRLLQVKGEDFRLTRGAVG